MCHGISLLNCLSRQRRHVVLSCLLIWVKTIILLQPTIGGSERARGLYSHLSLSPLVLAHSGWYVATTSYLFLYFSKFNLELRINQVENVGYQLVKYFIHYYQLRKKINLLMPWLNVKKVIPCEFKIYHISIYYNYNYYIFIFYKYFWMNSCVINLMEGIL